MHFQPELLQCFYPLFQLSTCFSDHKIHMYTYYLVAPWSFTPGLRKPQIMIVIKHSLFTPLRTTLGGKSLENIFCHVNHQIWADINSLNFAQLHFRMFSSLIGFPM